MKNSSFHFPSVAQKLPLLPQVSSKLKKLVVKATSLLMLSLRYSTHQHGHNSLKMTQNYAGFCWASLLNIKKAVLKARLIPSGWCYTACSCVMDLTKKRLLSSTIFCKKAANWVTRTFLLRIEISHQHLKKFVSLRLFICLNGRSKLLTLTAPLKIALISWRKLLQEKTYERMTSWINYTVLSHLCKMPFGLKES